MKNNNISSTSDVYTHVAYTTYAPVDIKFTYVDLRNEVEPPKHQTIYSAGADIRSSENVTIHPNKTVVVRTNLIVDLPVDYFLEVRSRSGLAAKHSVFVLNSPGTIDADYKDEIKIILHNAGDSPFEIQKGDRIAQVLLRKYTQCNFINSDIDTTVNNRGGGFGSTGVE